MASPAAASVRPPRPKKEPQTLVIPKNAAEEQKLKLERLMKNPDKAVPIPEKMNEWAPRAPPEFVRDVMGSVYLYSAGLVLSHRGQDFMPASTEIKLRACACRASALPVCSIPGLLTESHLELWTVVAIGSSAGAGSGEFHVYRHLRRREYQRQDYMDAMAEKQKLDAEFQKRLEKNKIAAEEQTAKRRKKRQKLKEKKLLAKKMKLEQKKQKEEPSQCQEQHASSSDEASETEEEEEEPSVVIMGR